MPAQHCVRGDNEPEPGSARPWDHVEQNGDQCPVGPGELRSSVNLSLQHRELVTQDQDLGGLPRLLTTRQSKPGEQPTDEKEQKAQAHDPKSSQNLESRLSESGSNSADEVFGTHRFKQREVLGGLIHEHHYGT
jgi:hypothetical protein